MVPGHGSIRARVPGDSHWLSLGTNGTLPRHATPRVTSTLEQQGRRRLRARPSPPKRAVTKNQPTKVHEEGYGISLSPKFFSPKFRDI